MFKPIPEDLDLPDIGVVVSIFSRHLPEESAAITHTTGYWDGRHFRTLSAKDDLGSLIRYPMGWEEIQPSEEAKAALRRD